jgi:hypothetical protein
MRGWLAAPIIGLDGLNYGLIQVSDRYTGDFTATDGNWKPFSTLPIHGNKDPFSFPFHPQRVNESDQINRIGR